METGNRYGLYVAGGAAPALGAAPGLADVERDVAKETVAQLQGEVQLLNATISYLKEALNNKRTVEESMTNQVSKGGEVIQPTTTGTRGAARPGTADPQYQSVSEEVAQLRATVLALHQQMEKSAPGQNGEQPSPPSRSGIKRFQAVATFVFKKLFQFVTMLFGTIMGIVNRIVVLAIVLAFIYELLVVVPLVNYPGAVKEELGQQAETVKRFVVDGWQAARAITTTTATKSDEATAAPGKHSQKPANN